MSIVVARHYGGPCDWQTEATVSNYNNGSDRPTILHSMIPGSLNLAHVVHSQHGAPDGVPGDQWVVMYSRSLDSGLTFSTPSGISVGFGAAGSREWGAAVVEGLPGSDDAYVFFPVQDNFCGLGVSRIICRASRDMGESFEPGGVVVTDSAFRGIAVGAAYGTIKRHSPFGDVLIWTWPVVAIDTSHGDYRGRVYVAWCDLRNDTDDDNCNAPWTNADIYLTWSTDRCSTFVTPIRVNSDEGTTDQYMPALTVDPYGNVHVSYFDSSIDPAENLYLGAGPLHRFLMVWTLLTSTLIGGYRPHRTGA